MSGAYTHIAAANSARVRAKDVDLRDSTNFVLGLHLRYVELGALSPDYPYLSMTQHQSRWADEMHYTNTALFIRNAVAEVQRHSGLRQQKLTAWLFGVASHIATDMTIHPVVEMKVGPYAENKSGHRNCEMHQDAYIFPRVMDVGETTYSEHMKSGIGGCVDRHDRDKLDPDIAQSWIDVLHATHPRLAARHPAQPDKWHEGFGSVLSTMAGASRLVPFARHVVKGAGLLYPLSSEVDAQYVHGLRTPTGLMDFEELFDKACRNVVEMWRGLDLALADADNGALGRLEDWDLDTGRSLSTGQLVFWGAQA